MARRLVEGTFGEGGARRRDFVRITEQGRQTVSSGTMVDLGYFNRFSGFQTFRNGPADDVGAAQINAAAGAEVMTPDDQLDQLVRVMNRELAAELLEQLRTEPAAFFEHVVRRLLRMGYGGSFDDAGKAIGRSGDGGIDGLIKQDRLGLDSVYVQAKRFAADRTVGAEVVRNLAGH